MMMGMEMEMAIIQTDDAWDENHSQRNDIVDTLLSDSLQRRRKIEKKTCGVNGSTSLDNITHFQVAISISYSEPSAIENE